MATGVYGRVGFGGMVRPLQMPYSDGPPFTISKEPSWAFQYIREVFALPLRRECNLCAQQRPPLIIAADGRLDDSAPASVAVPVLDPESLARKSWVAYIPDELCVRWPERSQQRKLDRGGDLADMQAQCIAQV